MESIDFITPLILIPRIGTGILWHPWSVYLDFNLKSGLVNLGHDPVNAQHKCTMIPLLRSSRKIFLSLLDLEMCLIKYLPPIWILGIIAAEPPDLFPGSAQRSSACMHSLSSPPLDTLRKKAVNLYFMNLSISYYNPKLI